MAASDGEKLLIEVCRALLVHFRKFGPDYSHKYSPKKFTEAQLKTLWWLHTVSKLKTVDPKNIIDVPPCWRELSKRLPVLSYRRIVKLLKESPALRQALELKRIPDYSTLCQFDRRRRRSTTEF